MSQILYSSAVIKFIDTFKPDVNGYTASTLDEFKDAYNVVDLAPEDLAQFSERSKSPLIGSDPLRFRPGSFTPPVADSVSSSSRSLPSRDFTFADIPVRNFVQSATYKSEHRPGKTFLPNVHGLTQSARSDTVRRFNLTDLGKADAPLINPKTRVGTMVNKLNNTTVTILGNRSTDPIVASLKDFDLTNIVKSDFQFSSLYSTYLSRPDMVADSDRAFIRHLSRNEPLLFKALANSDYAMLATVASSRLAKFCDYNLFKVRILGFCLALATAKAHPETYLRAFSDYSRLGRFLSHLRDNYPAQFCAITTSLPPTVSTADSVSE